MFQNASSFAMRLYLLYKPTFAEQILREGELTLPRH